MREDSCLLCMRRGDAVRSSVDDLPSLFSQMQLVPRVVATVAWRWLPAAVHSSAFTRRRDVHASPRRRREPASISMSRQGLKAATHLGIELHRAAIELAEIVHSDL